MSVTPQHLDGVRASTRADYLERMARLQRHLESNLDAEPLDPQTLARVASMSRAHFHRVFRAMFGVPIMEHVRRLRLERAAHRLRFQASPRLLDLAMEAGYGSHEAFTRAFQAHFGLPPSVWRETPSARVASVTPTLALATADVDIRRVPARAAMTRRHWGASPGVSPAFASAVTQGRELGHQVTRLIGVFHDDPEITRPERLRADVGFVCAPEAAKTHGTLTAREIPAGMYATLRHHGSYETLSESYLELIGRWLPSSGYELDDQGVVEVYLNDPTETPVERLITEIQVRLMPA